MHRDNVWVPQLGGDAGLTLETLGGIGLEPPSDAEDLQRHVAVELRVSGAIHRP